MRRLPNRDAAIALGNSDSHTAEHGDVTAHRLRQSAASRMEFDFRSSP